MFPSSIFADTLAAREGVAFDFRSGCVRLALLIVLEMTLFVALSAALFLMIEARLCRFPPLVGLVKVFIANIKRFDHALRSSGVCVTLCKRVDRAVQQAGLADLGMCLMIGTFTDG
jgi:hypothetical protein